MKFIVSADWHLKDWSDKEFTSDGTPRKLQEILDAVDSMCKYAMATPDIRTLFVPGDVNDTKNIASVNGFTRLQEIMESYPQIRFIISHGNHDAVGNMKERSAIQLLNGPPNIETYVDTFIEDNIAMIPYSSHVVDDIQEIYERHEDVKILLAHFGLNEGSLSSGISLRTSIRASMLTRFNLVILGHYHKPQMLIEGNTAIYYVGSPIPLRRDEWEEEKRFLVVDSETFEVESVPTTGYRKYYQFTIDQDTNVEMMSERIQEIKDEGHHIVVRNTLKDIPEELKNVTDGVKILNEHVDDGQLRGITSMMDTEKQLKEYTVYKEIPETEQSEYLEVATEIFNFQEE